MLKERDTFTLVEGKPQVYRAEHDAAYYRSQPEGAGAADGRRTAAALQVQPLQLPSGVRGRVHESARRLSARRSAGRSTAASTRAAASSNSRHMGWTRPPVSSPRCTELGHAFGLPHVDVYGYDMDANPSIMSYNPTHHTDGFKPSKTPGILNPEDIRALALNRRIFPRLRFDPEKDVPKSYTMQKSVVLGPMEIPGHPQISTTVAP